MTGKSGKLRRMAGDPAPSQRDLDPGTGKWEGWDLLSIVAFVVGPVILGVALTQYGLPNGPFWGYLVWTGALFVTLVGALSSQLGRNYIIRPLFRTEHAWNRRRIGVSLFGTLVVWGLLAGVFYRMQWPVGGVETKRSAPGTTKESASAFGLRFFLLRGGETSTSGEIGVEFRLHNTTTPPAELHNVFGNLWIQDADVTGTTILPSRRQTGRVEWDIQIPVLPKEGWFLPAAVKMRMPLPGRPVRIGAQFVSSETERYEYLWEIENRDNVATTVTVRNPHDNGASATAVPIGPSESASDPKSGITQLSWPTLALVAVLAVALGAMYLTHRAKLAPVGQIAAPISWSTLEERFQALLERDVRVNNGDPTHAFESDMSTHQGAWYVGGGTRDITDEAVDLCAIAGRKLKNDGLASSPRLSRVENDVDRWLWYLVEVGETSADERTTLRSGDGSERHLYQHDYLLNACVNGCRKVQVSEV